MKKMCVLLMVVAVSGFAFAGFDDFSTVPADGDWSFNRSPGTWAASGYTWGATVGTDAGGGLTTANNPAEIRYTPETFDLTVAGAVLTHSWDVQFDRTAALLVSANQAVSVGVAPTVGGKIGGGLRARINYNPSNDTPEFVWYGETNTGDLDAGIIDGHWYRVEAVYTAVGTDQITYSYSAYDLGTDGLATPLLISQVGKTITHAALRGATDAVISFKSRVDHGVPAADNFSSSFVVPEPVSMALLGLGSIVALRRRRK